MATTTVITDDLTALRDIAEKLIISQARWARVSRIDRARLNMAINGHVDITTEEVDQLRTGLASIIRERIVELTEIVEHFGKYSA